MPTDAISKKYTCPHCYKEYTSNQVLFFRSVATSKPDARQLTQKQLFTPSEDALEQWVLDTKFPTLCDWRTYPATQRIVERGMVIGLHDYHGATLHQKACPYCHFPLPAKQYHTLLVWTQTQEDATAVGRALFETLCTAPASSWKIPEIQPSAYDQNPKQLHVQRKDGTVHVVLPDWFHALSPDDGEMWKARYFQQAEQAIVQLPAPQNSFWSDDAAQEYLPHARDVMRTYLDARGYVGKPLSCPTVVFIDIAQWSAEVPVAELEAQFTTAIQTLYKPLEQQIALSLQNVLILPWGVANERIAAQAMQWLIAQSDALDA